MTHWLAHIPNMPTFTAWPILAGLANGDPQW